MKERGEFRLNFSKLQGNEDVENYGGFDPLDLEFIEEVDMNVPGYDKGGHMLRSMANSPNHRKHWRKR